jgi:hypothetical protein
MRHNTVVNVPTDPKQLMLDAIEVSFRHFVHERSTESNPSAFVRAQSSLTFEQAYDLINPYNPHWVIMFRNEEYWTGNSDDNYWEFGGCNLANNGYGEVYVFIRVKEDRARELFEKYGLTLSSEY